MPRYDISRAEQFEFIAGYIEAMLWANTYEDVEGECVSADDALSHELSDEARQTLEQDCFDFLTPQVVRLIDGAMRRGSRYQTYGLSGAGHDFALTRNGHGAGFWGRGFGIVGEALTEIARPYGTRSLYIDVNGIVQIFE